MFSRIEKLKEKKLIGKSIKMSLSNNKTEELWQSFMPHRMQIKNRVGSHYYSIQVYDSEMSFSSFNPSKVFLKCAMVECNNLDEIPDGMEARILESGLYAVFIHKGKPSAFAKTAQYIYGQWIPQSKYQLDQRPHFEILGEKYQRNSDESEEEVWIPII